MSFIGIDLGTTFLKGAVLNLKARRLEHIRRMPFPERLANANPLQWEFDPSEIVAAVQTVIAELTAHAPDCEGLVMSSQMHGLVLTDNRGEAVSNCVSWRDQRVLMPHPSGPGSYFDEIVRRVSPQQRRQLGHELEPGRPICVLYWLAEQGKLSPGCTPLSMPDFVLGRLCHSTPGVEATHASASGAFNLETLDWHYDVIKELGLAHLRWPSLRKHGEVAGCLKLGANWVPCYTPVGDYQCSLAGALLGAEELSLNISTGSQISRLTSALSLGDYQTRPFFDQEFLNTFTNTPGGRSLDVLIDLFSELTAARNTNLQDPWTIIAQATTQVAETDLQVDLNFFPEPDENRGMISNIRGDNFTVGHLFRAAFNDMAERYHACALRLWPERLWKNLVFSGGVACRLEVLRETIQERFGTGYRLAPFKEDALFGLLILGLVFSGEADSVKEATKELRSIYQTEGQDAQELAS
jgi:sedoheptulokinase